MKIRVLKNIVKGDGMGGKKKKLKFVEEKPVGQNSNRPPKKDNYDNSYLLQNFSWPF